MRVLICGSIAFDNIMVFNGRFQDQILPDQIHILNVAFLVPEMRREFGGCAGNIAYNLQMLGGEAHRGLVIQQVARDLGHDTRQIPEDLQVAVIHSFEANWRDERKRAAYGFHMPFGEGSHRWGLKAGLLH